MENNTIANERVRTSIIEALFSLLTQKKFSEITVTDLINNANVARASYYRNFDSKEAIIEEYMDTTYNKLIISNLNEDYEANEIFDYTNMVEGFRRSLTYFLANKSYIIALYDNGFSSLIQETLNRYIEELVGDMSKNSIERFQLYFISGAVFNILIQWLKSGAIESPLEIAKMSANYLINGVVQ
jgi:AcrR family transcriptional regulator